MGEEKGKKQFQTEREANHKRLLNTENKLRVDGCGGSGGRGKRLRRALVGMSTGCCMEAMNHGNLPRNQEHTVYTVC